MRWLKNLSGLLLLLAVYAWIVGACFRGIRVRRQDAIYPTIGLAAAALVGLHALVDFSVQIPAVAALFAMLLGVGYSQAFPTGGGRHNPALMAAIAEAVQGEVVDADELGWDGDALEAQAFAYLAVRSVLGLDITFPGTTGVAEPRTGGKRYFSSDSDAGTLASR